MTACLAPGCVKPVHGHGWCRGHYHRVVTLGQPTPAPIKRREPPAWMDLALCAEVDTDLFFPEPGNYATARAARKICAACPVTPQCLDHAFLTGAGEGIWGGKTARERRTMLRGTERAA